jgi:hypothetical protein
MPDIHGFIQLEYFVEEVRDHLERVEGELVTNGSLEVGVLVLRDLHSGEQVLDDAHEEGQVLGEELRNVAVTHGSDQHNVLRQVGVGSPQLSCQHQH